MNFAALRYPDPMLYDSWQVKVAVLYLLKM